VPLFGDLVPLEEATSVTPVTLGGGSKWGSPNETSGTTFPAYVLKLSASQATREGRTSTRGQYRLYAEPPPLVNETQKLDVPGVGRLDVLSVVHRKLDDLEAVIIEAERVS
jgi:hypothetical protein